ncbi:MAG: hypothetical protein RRA51_09205 [Armatimonadota bacterium]|nr:hypothetical protein [Armatimonadota bacterium]
MDEPKRIVSTLNRTKRVLQVGTQGMSDSIWEQVAELIKAGEIGTLIQAQAADMRTDTGVSNRTTVGLKRSQFGLGHVSWLQSNRTIVGLKAQRNPKNSRRFP